MNIVFSKDVIEDWHKTVRMVDIYIKTRRIEEAQSLMKYLVEAIDKETAYEKNHEKHNLPNEKS